MPLLLSAFSNVLPQVICGQPIGRECDTKPVSNCRGARLMGVRATWPAQRIPPTFTHKYMSPWELPALCPGRQKGVMSG